MTSTIENLEERDDVVKTEYTRHVVGEGEVNVELWHDIESLQRIVERVMTGAALSNRGVQELAENKALAVRKTTTSFNAMYPDLTKQFLCGARIHDGEGTCQVPVDTIGDLCDKHSNPSRND